MKQCIFIIFNVIIISCSIDTKRFSDNDVQEYYWLGVTGNEEIRNDTIFTYNEKIGSDDFTFRVIKKVTDSTITYRYHYDDTDSSEQHTVAYENKLIDSNPYLLIYYKSSVSMFTRKRSCPYKIRSLF